MPTPDNSAPLQPKEKANLAFWLLGLLVVAAVVLGLGSVLAGRFLRDNIEVIRTDPEAEAKAQANALRLAAEAKPEIALPLYPGAEVVEEPDTVEIVGADETSVFITSARYKVRDTLENVDAWYREKLGADYLREPPGVANRRRNIHGVAVALEDVVYLYETPERMRVVALHPKGQEVEIALARMGLAEE